MLFTENVVPENVSLPENVHSLELLFTENVVHSLKMFHSLKMLFPVNVGLNTLMFHGVDWTDGEALPSVITRGCVY